MYLWKKNNYANFNIAWQNNKKQVPYTNFHFKLYIVITYRLCRKLIYKYLNLFFNHVYLSVCIGYKDKVSGSAKKNKVVKHLENLFGFTESWQGKIKLTIITHLYIYIIYKSFRVCGTQHYIEFCLKLSQNIVLTLHTAQQRVKIVYFPGKEC